MDTGAADSIVDTLVSRSSPAMIPWTMALIGALIGLPMFFEVGLVMMVPVVILVVRRTHLPLMRVAIPTLAGLSVMHAAVPPHPGPLAALSCFNNANIGLTMMFGIPIAILTIVIVGPAFSKLASKWVPVGAPEEFVPPSERNNQQPRAVPPFRLSIICIVLPALLMLIASVFEIVDSADYKSGALWSQMVIFLGKPEMALLMALLVSMVILGVSGHVPFSTMNASLSASLPTVAGVLLIVGGGGGYKGMLVDTGIGSMIGSFVDHSHSRFCCSVG